MNLSIKILKKKIILYKYFGIYLYIWVLLGIWVFVVMKIIGKTNTSFKQWIKSFTVNTLVPVFIKLNPITPMINRLQIQDKISRSKAFNKFLIIIGSSVNILRMIIKITFPTIGIIRLNFVWTNLQHMRNYLSQLTYHILPT